MKSWEDRRTEFNHDWLKNRFMPSLSKALNLLDDVIEDPAFENSFITQVLPQWENKSKSARELIQCFAFEMSPKSVLDQYPLSRLDDESKELLSEILHNLWLRRYQVNLAIKQAELAVSEADATYFELQTSLQNTARLNSAQDWRFARNELAEFRKKCQKLANALSSFHGGGKVI